MAVQENKRWGFEKPITNKKIAELFEKTPEYISYLKKRKPNTYKLWLYGAYMHLNGYEVGDLEQAQKNCEIKINFLHKKVENLEDKIKKLKGNIND